MQAIRTRYMGPTNAKGSRVQAKCEAKTIYIEWDDALNSEENHKAACDAIITRMGWNSPHFGCSISGVFDGDYYWVEDQKRLTVLKGLVNHIRDGSFSGNPWCKKSFLDAVAVIGLSYGYWGDVHGTPTTDTEASALKAPK